MRTRRQKLRNRSELKQAWARLMRSRLLLLET
jgi:hypothetical protein